MKKLLTKLFHLLTVQKWVLVATTILLLVVVWYTIGCWNLNAPNQKITHEQILKQTKEETDNALIAAPVPTDSAKLQAIAAFKYRIAKARFLDSLRRAKNK